jgi:hypothetical protein
MNLKKLVRLRAEAVDAVVSTSDISRQFYGEWAQGDRYWWWLCAILVDPMDLIVEDDEGKLWRLAYTVGDREVTFGELTEVYIDYVDAIARREQNGAALKAITDTRGAEKVSAVYSERPSNRPKTKEGDDVREFLEKLRAKHGLPATATDEEILKAAAEAPDPEDPPADDPPADDPPADDPPAADPPADDPPAQQPQAATVDAGALAQLQADAALGRKAGELMLKNEREAHVDDAIAKGKVPAASRPNLLAEAERDQKAGRTTTFDYLAALTANVIPVEQRAVTEPTNEGGTQIDASAVNSFLGRHMPDVAAKKAAIAAGTHNRVTIAD